MPVLHGDKIKQDEIDMLEKKYGIQLEESYKFFLKSENGFLVKQPDYCEFDFDNVDDGVIALYSLYSLGNENENNELIYNNDEFLNELEFIDSAFIIGGDPGGNYFVLMGNKNHKGVFYWDRTHLHADDDKSAFSIPEHNESGNLYKVSSSFKDFYELIKKNTFIDGVPYLK